MRYRGLLVVLCVNLLLVAAAPVQNVEHQAALLQRALDDAVTKKQVEAATAGDSQDTSESGQDENDFVIDFMEKLIDIIKTKFGKDIPSTPSTKEDLMAALESSTREDTALYILGKVFDFIKRKYDQSRSPDSSTLQSILDIDEDQNPLIYPYQLNQLQSDSTGSDETTTQDVSWRPLHFLSFLRKKTTEHPYVIDGGQKFVPRVISATYRPKDPRTPLGTTEEDTDEAEVQAFAAILGTALKALKGLSLLKNLIPKSGSRSGSNSGSNTGDRGFGISPPSEYENIARGFLGFPTRDDNVGFNGPSDRPQKTETDNKEERVDEQVTNEAEIEKFKWLKSLAGKTLKVLKHKLKPRSRSPEEDERAVYRPTKWKDLGRNILGTLGDSLDPTNEEVEAETEHLMDETKDERSKYSAAEIEGLRSFLSKALKHIDSKLKPSSRSPEEDEQAVRDPSKWTDLGRNFLRVLKNKLDNQKTRPVGESEAEIEGEFPEQDFEGKSDDETLAIEKSWNKPILP